ncbi:MAG: hypothetical protein D6765_15120, partial [Bacteroidetes bacterium]
MPRICGKCFWKEPRGANFRSPFERWGECCSRSLNPRTTDHKPMQMKYLFPLAVLLVLLGLAGGWWAEGGEG